MILKSDYDKLKRTSKPCNGDYHWLDLFKCPTFDKETKEITGTVRAIIFGGKKTFRFPVYEDCYSKDGTYLGNHHIRNELKDHIINSQWFLERYRLVSIGTEYAPSICDLEGQWTPEAYGFHTQSIYYNLQEYIIIYNPRDHSNTSAARHVVDCIEDFFDDRFYNCRIDTPFNEVITANARGGLYWRPIDPRILLTRKLIPGVNCWEETLEDAKEVFPKIEIATMQDKVDFMIKLLGKKCSGQTLRRLQFY